MEPLTEMLKNLMEAQNRTMSFWMETAKTPLSVAKEYAEKITPFKTPLDFVQGHQSSIDNAIKFHKAAIAYNQSIVDMLEIYQETTKMFTEKK